MAAKRSPILGYNHNVRFRGIVFHIQTEDSGIVNPHVFSHLFHGGVILSTRKLVYDPGANDEAVKSLMQAQHKAVMKDLRRGAFDDKIDAYLAGTPGLLPRESAGGAAPVEELVAVAAPTAAPPPVAVASPAPVAGPPAPEVSGTAPTVRGGREAAPPPRAPVVEPAARADDGVPRADADPGESQPIVIESFPMHESAPIELPRAARAARPSEVQRAREPAPMDAAPIEVLEPGESIPIELTPRVRPPIATPPAAPPAEARLRPDTEVSATLPFDEPVGRAYSEDDSGEVQIEVVVARPQAVLLEDSDLLDAAPMPVELPPVAAPQSPAPAPTRSLAPTGSPTAATTSPPAATTPPPVVAATATPTPPRGRPHPTPPVVGMPPELGRAPTIRSPGAPPPLPPPSPEEPDSFANPDKGDISSAMRAIQVTETSDDDAARIHAPALPSAPQPPGAAPERVGEYHLARKPTESGPPTARPVIPKPTPLGSRVPTPSTSRPPASSPPSPRVPAPALTPTRPGHRTSVPPAAPAAGTPRSVPPVARQTPTSPVPPRVLTPARTDSPAPSASRPPIQPARRPVSGGGVVVSRPAVIVGGRGAPTAPPTKVRRARDAESFGGDLISERSLDEVILAYLSEDNNEE